MTPTNLTISNDNVRIIHIKRIQIILIKIYTYKTLTPNKVKFKTLDIQSIATKYKSKKRLLMRKRKINHINQNHLEMTKMDKDIKRVVKIDPHIQKVEESVTMRRNGKHEKKSKSNT